MKTLKALKGHSYANKFQTVGAIYNASDADANLMVLLKNSEYFTAPAEVPKARRPYVRRNLQADKPVGYTTKEMKA